MVFLMELGIILGSGNQLALKFFPSRKVVSWWCHSKSWENNIIARERELTVNIVVSLRKRVYLFVMEICLFFASCLLFCSQGKGGYLFVS